MAYSDAKYNRDIDTSAYDDDFPSEIINKPQSGISDAPSGKPARGFVRLDERPAAPTDWLVRGLIPADSLGMIFGEPRSCKSFIAMDLAASIAGAETFHGYTVKKQGAALYFAGEGQGGLARRLEAWKIRHGCKKSLLPVYVFDGVFTLCDRDGTDETMVCAAIEELQKTGEDIRLIIFDTLHRTLGGDENSSEDISKALGVLDRIRKQTHATILLVHHSGHGEKNRARGSSAIFGALDFASKVTRKGNNSVLLECTKMKDAREPEALSFVLHEVDLGFDEEDKDGKLRKATSLILDDGDTTGKKQESPKRQLGSNQGLGLSVLNELVSKQTENLELDGRAGDSVRVRLEDWRNACKEQGLVRQRISEVQSWLVAVGLVEIKAGYFALKGKVDDFLQGNTS